MIKGDFHSFLDHRIQFYELLKVRASIRLIATAAILFHASSLSSGDQRALF